MKIMSKSEQQFGTASTGSKMQQKANTSRLSTATATSPADSHGTLVDGGEGSDEDEDENGGEDEDEDTIAIDSAAKRPDLRGSCNNTLPISSSSGDGSTDKVRRQLQQRMGVRALLQLLKPADLVSTGLHCTVDAVCDALEKCELRSRLDYVWCGCLKVNPQITSCSLLVLI